MSTLLIVLLILIVLGGVPAWQGKDWGYGPIGLILVIVLILALLGRI